MCEFALLLGLAESLSLKINMIYMYSAMNHPSPALDDNEKLMYMLCSP